ncbi:MAG: hypothetical protein AAB213_04200 [Candidatus Omnitrophota bacterium]
MKKILNILLCLTMPLIFSSSLAFAKRVPLAWDELIKSSEFIAMASLVKIEENLANNKTIATFKILSVYKGDRVESIEVDNSAGRIEDTVVFNETGMYILFLKKASGNYPYKYELSAERFFKIAYLRETSGKSISVIDETSYSYLTGIPEELFIEKEIRLSAYGKSFDFKTKVIEESNVEKWLWKTFPADFTRSKVNEESDKVTKKKDAGEEKSISSFRRIIKRSVGQGDYVRDQRSPQEACNTIKQSVCTDNSGFDCKLIDSGRVDSPKDFVKCVDGVFMGGCFSCVFGCNPIKSKDKQ